MNSLQDAMNSLIGFQIGPWPAPLNLSKKVWARSNPAVFKSLLTRFETFQTELEQQNSSQILLISYSKSPENFMEKPQMVIELEAFMCFP